MNFYELMFLLLALLHFIANANAFAVIAFFKSMVLPSLVGIGVNIIGKIWPSAGKLKHFFLHYCIINSVFLYFRRGHGLDF